MRDGMTGSDEQGKKAVAKLFIKISMTYIFDFVVLCIYECADENEHNLLTISSSR